MRCGVDLGLRAAARSRRVPACGVNLVYSQTLGCTLMSLGATWVCMNAGPGTEI